MSLHVFGAIVTHHGTAANNRAETDGNVTTLQKLLWHGRVHSSVSAEAIRFALRRRLAEHEPTNRQWDDDQRTNVWSDPAFASWAGKDGKPFIDDDLLGFMSAEAAKEENGPEAEAPSEERGKKARTKGGAKVRRAVLEITRAISLIPYGGDVTFNAASPGATPSAQKKGLNPVPYGTELHATRYQYGFALTPGSLRKPERAAVAIQSLCALGEVAGNHGRFLYDFSPESVVFRVTDDPAPRLLYLFEENGRAVDAPALLTRVKAGDLPAGELIIGGAFSQTETAKAVAALGATVEPGVRSAARLVCERIAS
jgi:CRISPR-associated protein Cst2